jgi:hypothetical protein
VGEYKSRSNDPRVTKGAKKDKYKYDMALEVALQPADTPERKRMKKDAQNYVRAFESRFQKEAFVRSGRMPYTAGGKGENTDERFVDKNPANDNKKKTASKSTVKKAAVKPKAKAMPAGVKRRMAGSGKPLLKKTGKK